MADRLARLTLVLVCTIVVHVASVSAHSFRVVNQVGFPSVQLHQIEHAITLQSRQVRSVWHSPVITWSATGWPIYLQHYHGQPDNGFHNFNRNGPYAVVRDTKRFRFITIPLTLSHEAEETNIDPYFHRILNGQDVEICDPTVWSGYRVVGVKVADWVFPAFYFRANRRWDWMRLPRR